MDVCERSPGGSVGEARDLSPNEIIAGIYVDLGAVGHQQSSDQVEDDDVGPAAGAGGGRIPRLGKKQIIPPGKLLPDFLNKSKLHTVITGHAIVTPTNHIFWLNVTFHSPGKVVSPGEIVRIRETTRILRVP